MQVDEWNLHIQQNETASWRVITKVSSAYTTSCVGEISVDGNEQIRTSFEEHNARLARGLQELYQRCIAGNHIPRFMKGGKLSINEVLKDLDISGPSVSIESLDPLQKAGEETQPLRLPDPKPDSNQYAMHFGSASEPHGLFSCEDFLPDASAKLDFQSLFQSHGLQAFPQDLPRDLEVYLDFEQYDFERCGTWHEPKFQEKSSKSYEACDMTTMASNPDLAYFKIYESCKEGTI
jgi:hypothetical protein